MTPFTTEKLSEQGGRGSWGRPTFLGVATRQTGGGWSAPGHHSLCEANDLGQAFGHMDGMGGVHRTNRTIGKEATKKERWLTAGLGECLKKWRNLMRLQSRNFSPALAAPLRHERIQTFKMRTVCLMHMFLVCGVPAGSQLAGPPPSGPHIHPGPHS